MSYATQADLAERFGETELVQLTDRDGVDAVDQAVLARALADADAEIEARLQARYALPLASVPRLLVGIAADIARYRLYDDRATEQVRRRYEDATKLLDRIGKGELMLGLDLAQQAAAQTSGGPAFTEPRRVFSREQLGDYS